MMLQIFFVGFFICLFLAVLSLRTSKTAFMCRVPSKRNGFLTWSALAVVCLLAMALTAPKDEFGNVIIPQDERNAAVMQDN